MKHPRVEMEMGIVILQFGRQINQQEQTAGLIIGLSAFHESKMLAY